MCCIKDFHVALDGENCVILDIIDAVKGEWYVRVQGGPLRGKEMALAESSLRFGYSMLPSSVQKLHRFCEISSEDTQGSCGRGLVTARPVKAGMPIFEEPPFLVAYKSSNSPQEHHLQRWLAYATLLSNSQRADARNADVLAEALQAFNNLGVADHVPEHVHGAPRCRPPGQQDGRRCDGRRARIIRGAGERSADAFPVKPVHV